MFRNIAFAAAALFATVTALSFAILPTDAQSQLAGTERAAPVRNV